MEFVSADTVYPPSVLLKKLSTLQFRSNVALDLFIWWEFHVRSVIKIAKFLKHSPFGVHQASWTDPYSNPLSATKRCYQRW